MRYGRILAALVCALFASLPALAEPARETA